MSDLANLLALTGCLILAGIAGILLYIGSRPDEDERPPWWETYHFDGPGPNFGRELPARTVEEAEVGDIRVRV